MAEFSQQYGDKFADGSRTLAYSKVAEPVMVNKFDILDQDVDKLKGNIDRIDGSIKSLDIKFENKIDNLGVETTRAINELRHDIYTGMETMNEHLNADDVKLNILLITLYQILQIWPLRFLNRIFKWWTYEIIQESRTDEDTYIFYVQFILRGPKTRKEQIKYEKRFKNRIKTVKKLYEEKNVKLNYLVKPYFKEILL